MRGSRPPCPVPRAGQPRARLRPQTLDLPDERRWQGPWGAPSPPEYCGTGGGWQKELAVPFLSWRSSCDWWLVAGGRVLPGPQPPVPHPRLIYHQPGDPWSKAGPNVCTKRSPFQGKRTGWGTKGGLRLLEFSRRGSSRKTLEIGWALASTLICLFLSRLNPSRVVSGTVLLVGLLPEGKSNPFTKPLY